MPPARQEPPALPKPVLLFLDDNLNVLELYKAYFGHNGYSVLTSSRCPNAIRLAEVMPVRVAVVDYDMPEMNGHEAALALKRVRPALPVILVSGNEKIPPDALQAVDFFVPKGAGPHELGEIIERFVQG